MTERAPAPLEVEFSEPRGPIRWRRWLGLSLPLSIGLVFLLSGALADVLAPHDPRLRRSVRASGAACL